MRWIRECPFDLLPAVACAWRIPHVFIDTGLDFIVDEAGQLTHVRVTWSYDALYSLLVLEDFGAGSGCRWNPDRGSEEKLLTGFRRAMGRRL